jgi:ABC-type glycerol-3-phosphate transport system substrate-binding protein
MRKIALLIAAFAALAIAAAPLSSAFAQAKKEKKLWEGWVEEMQKAAKKK